MTENFLIFRDFIKRLYIHRSMIWIMATREIRLRYAGTFGGFIWFIINPLLMILVYWFVFSAGFKVQPVGGYPFIVVFLCGMLPYTTLNETLVASANCINANAHLVKKTVFPTEILPIVNLVASFISHAFMAIILIVLMLFYGIDFSLFNLQILYFLAALSFFCIGLGWLLSSINVFFRDTAQMLGVILNLWFWFTPIIWGMNMVPAKYHIFFKLNPLLYIVEGYKSSLLYHLPFWQNYVMGAYFWGLSLFFFITGALVFRRLKPEFAEVL